MMPMATGVAWADTTPIESVTFGYAYDTQREIGKAYPTSSQEVQLSEPKFPLVDYNEKRKNTCEGQWKLIKLGTYSYISSSGITSANLNGIVTNVYNAYNNVSAPLDKNSIIIHELKDGDTHVAYGVVIAYNAAKGYVGFIGDTWSAGNGGAFYLLSNSAISHFPGTITA